MSQSPRVFFWSAAVALAAGVSLNPAAATGPASPAPVKIAVFDFELDDMSPAAALTNLNTTEASSIAQVSAAARNELEKSGRYTLVDTHKADIRAVTDKKLRDCDGCEAQIARQLGADQALIGVLRRATQTDYYIAIQIRDAHTGKVLEVQEANFAGDQTGWPTGVRMLIKHQLLAAAN